MKKVKAFILATFIIPLFVGCGAVQIAGDIMRSEKKDVDIVLSPDVTPSMLQKMKNIGVNINGINSQTGQFIYAQGAGGTNASVYSDMLTKEFMKAGYKARTITENISETSPKEKLGELEKIGIDIVLIGNMNISTTTSTFSYLTGGDIASTGVISFTVKGLDVKSGEVLFIISTEYGKAKAAGEVTKDLGDIYRDIVMGKTKNS